MKKRQVVDRRQDRAEHLLGQKQMPQIRAAESAAGQALATFLERSGIKAMHGVPNEIVERQLAHFAKADSAYAEGVRRAMKQHPATVGVKRAEPEPQLNPVGA